MSTQSTNHQCCQCNANFDSFDELESHISADHLDYYPYGCGHCGHWLATEEIAHFHAKKKNHLPMKIKENIDVTKERKLKSMLELSTRDGNGGAKNSASGNDAEIFVIDDDETARSLTSTPIGNNGARNNLTMDARKASPVFQDPNYSKQSTSMASKSGVNKPSSMGNTSRSTNSLVSGYGSAISSTVTNSPTKPTVNRVTVTATTLMSARAKRRLNKSIGVVNSAVRSPVATRTTSEVRNRKHFQCKICFVMCMDALISSHIYQVHINDRTAVKCAYCSYSVAYNVAEINRHITKKHPGKPRKMVDRRGALQEVYFQWREQCFPEIGKRQSQLLKAPVQQTISGAVNNSNIPPVRTNNSANSASLRHHKQFCKRCGIWITQWWVPRHVWKHLSDEQGINCYRCGIDNCDYATYLMRTFEMHYAAHNVDKTTQAVSVVDRRNDYVNEFNECLSTCFGDDYRHQHDQFQARDEDDGFGMVTAGIGASPMDADEIEAMGSDEYSSVVKCKSCDAAVRVYDLEEHIWTDHMQNERPYTCNTCQSRFSQAQDVQQHCQLVHNSQGNYHHDHHKARQFQVLMEECYSPEASSSPISTIFVGRRNGDGDGENVKSEISLFD